MPNNEPSRPQPDPRVEKALRDYDGGRALDALLTEEEIKEQHLIDWAWSIIANAGGGDWERESADWQEAAAKWRHNYHLHLSRRKGYPLPDARTR